MLGEDRSGVVGDFYLARLSRPAAHIAISQQRKPPKLITPTRVLQVGQKIVKAQLEAK
jgi:hypothetical protein